MDVLKYAEFYCFRDCQILAEGYNCFNKDILKLSNNELSVFNSLSISSVANKLIGLKKLF